jgi:hypothetical protein
MSYKENQNDDNDVIFIEEIENEVIVIEEISDCNKLFSPFSRQKAPQGCVIEEKADDNEVSDIEEDLEEPKMHTLRIEDVLDYEEIMKLDRREIILSPVKNEMNPIDSYFVPMTEEDIQMINRLHANSANISNDLRMAQIERDMEDYMNFMREREQEQGGGVTIRRQENETHDFR